MSLSQVARGDISRTALHLIETGKCRPSIVSLRLIADRTGKPVDYFLQPGQAVAVEASPLLMQDLELALAQERFDDAKSQARQLVKVVTEPAARGRICLMSAQAHLHTASVEEALPLLAEARVIFEASQDKLMLADCLDWQAAAEHLLEDPAALATARHALGIARALDPQPHRLLVRIYGRIGSICVSQHKWHDAIEMYENAVLAGAGLLDMSRLAKMYNDLSIAHRQIGRLTSAVEYAHKAISIHELLSDRLSIGRAETNLALVLMRRGDHDEAGRHLDRALNLFIEADQPRGRAHILLAQAELLRISSDLPGARAKALAPGSRRNSAGRGSRHYGQASEQGAIRDGLAELEGVKEQPEAHNNLLDTFAGTGLHTSYAAVTLVAVGAEGHERSTLRCVEPHPSHVPVRTGGRVNRSQHFSGQRSSCRRSCSRVGLGVRLRCPAGTFPLTRSSAAARSTP
jgi:tetratricopeptide (TPR) repeat protein